MANAVRDLEEVARAAQAVDGIESAAVFVAQPGSSELELAGAAGIDGPPLDGLVAAVRNPGTRSRGRSTTPPRRSTSGR